MSTESFAKTFRKYLVYAGLERFTRHGLRHYTATKMVARNPRSAQLLLGHRNIATTIKYDHTQIDQVRADHEIVSPLGNILRNKSSEAQRKSANKKKVL